MLKKATKRKFQVDVHRANNKKREEKNDDDKNGVSNGSKESLRWK